MDKMLLDREGKALIPDGYQVIDSDIDFLLYATVDRPLLVRGQRRCQWAAEFWDGRHIPYRELQSPVHNLREIVPDLDEKDAETICAALPESLLSRLGKLNLTKLLQALFPNVLWEKRPSKAHAADWLLWLYECTSDPLFEPILKAQARLWQQEVDDVTYSVYAATNAEVASKLLYVWLGLTPDDMLVELGRFPARLPDSLREQAPKVWKERIIARRGSLIGDLTDLPIRHELISTAAQETVNYLERHPRALTPTLRDQLVSYLTTEEQNRLLQLMPPPMPGNLPEEAEAVLAWFRSQYLPARQWQSVFGSEADRLMINQTAEQFAMWYLSQYPRALNGGSLQNHLCFSRTAASQQQETRVTLLIVLDGLHAVDAKQLLTYLQRQTDRLSVWEDGLAFAPLPTITEVCKPALLAGVAPELAWQMSALGELLPENRNPVESLRQALPGQLYIWRVQEPDRTYHQRNNSETLDAEIDGQLFTIAGKIRDVVKDVPSELPLSLILTSDHGRLLAKAVRQLEVPPGMQSHGRAAVGAARRTFGERGYAIDNGVVYLHAKRFGLLHDAAVAFGEETFRTNDGKTGSEWYPHGGLYPEEVIVPWIELMRDMALPEVTIELKGSGQAGQQGTFTIKLCNTGDIPVTATILTFIVGGRKMMQQVNMTVPPYTEESHEGRWDTWPNKAETESMTANLRLVLPNKLSFVVAIENPQIESIAMYQRDDILGDLEL